MVATIFSVIYTKKHNIRDLVAKISQKIIGCFTVLCIVFICLAGIFVQIFEPPETNKEMVPAVFMSKSSTLGKNGTILYQHGLEAKS